jgi:hypothetical protein
MGFAALACLALAVVPTLTVPAISRVALTLRIASPPIVGGVTAIRLTPLPAQFWPLWLAVGVVAVTGAVAVAARRLGRARRRTTAWDCGDGPLSPRMEYTATSYAEPLLRIFDDTLAPERDVDVTHDQESAYYIESVRYRQRIADRIENRLYRPLIGAIGRLGELARRLAPGVVHRYLAYMLTALIVVLAAGVIR